MDRIVLAHGGGGEEMNELISKIIFKTFDNEILLAQNDSAILPASDFFTHSVQKCDTQKLAFSTDSFVVNPIFFNGGDIGKLAVCGSINDLAMVGAEAKFLSCALLLEEGLEIKSLEKILCSMKEQAQNAGVKIVCGDTKVLPKGSADKIFINTSCIGAILRDGIETANLKIGAKILLSGDIGRHGAVILAHRENLIVDTQSDCQSLKDVTKALLDSSVRVLCMRDATRGGIAAVLNEWANFKGYMLRVYEDSIPITQEVLGICEILGFEPYEIANEGTFLLAVEREDEAKALEILRRFHPLAASIGEVVDDSESGVVLQTLYGSQRFLELPKGELLPRIC